MFKKTPKPKQKPYEYKISGIDSENKIIVLVDDKKYGDYSVAIHVTEMEETGEIQVTYDFTSKNKVPAKRQQELVTDVVNYIFEEIRKEIANEE